MSIQHLALTRLLVIWNNIEQKVSVDVVRFDYLTWLKHRSPLRYHLLRNGFVLVAIEDQLKFRHWNIEKLRINYI